MAGWCAAGGSFAISEWMWLLVDHSDDERRLVFGKLVGLD